MITRFLKVLSVPVMLACAIPFLVLWSIKWVFVGGKTFYTYVEDYTDWLDGSYTK